jgi:L-lactate dehydrogenase complex protein LldG
MYATFKARAEAVSAEVHRLPGRGEAVQFVLGLLQAEGISDQPGSRAVWAESGLLAGVDLCALAERVPGLHFDVTRESAAGAKVGITEVDFAVANTGTLAQAADRVDQRLASTLTEIHVALADPARVLPDLGALLRELGPARTRYLALVTGPSRTADIERVLTIGVHGPRRLVIVFVDGLKGEA